MSLLTWFRVRARAVAAVVTRTLSSPVLSSARYAAPVDGAASFTAPTLHAARYTAPVISEPAP